MVAKANNGAATKGARLAIEMREQLGQVIVPAGTDGRTVMTKVVAERKGMSPATVAVLAAQPKLKKSKTSLIPAAAVKLPVVASTRPAVADGFKWCSKHSQAHPVEEFARDKSSKDGRYSICKVAEAEWRTARKAQLAAAAQPEPVAVVAPEPVKKGSKKAAKN
jgi:hypothetical protein